MRFGRTALSYTEMRRLLGLLLITACGSSSDGVAPAPTPPAALVPKIHFTVGGAEVDSIVYTDAFAVRIDGLAPHATVTLEAKSYSPSSMGRGYTSSNTFTADDAGVVDTSTLAPTPGTYEGVDPDGIVWSMKEGPLAEGLGARSSLFFHVTIGESGLDASLKRTLYAANVTVTPVTENGLVGEWYLPAGATDKVPILAFGGSEGGISGGRTFASRMASWGYPTLAVAYFGAPGLPTELVNVPLEYFDKAFAWMDKQPSSRKGKAIVVGASRGGELALLLGSKHTNVVGVIAATPSSYVWGGDSQTDSHAKSWTLGGTALPDIPASTLGPPETIDGPNGDPAYRLRPTFEADLAAASPAVLEAARIRVEDIKGPIFMFGGDDDQLWPACTFISRATEKLADHGFEDEGICFPGAGHLLEATGVPLTESMFAPEGSLYLALGGTARGNAQSGRISDVKIHAFLDQNAR